MGGRFRLLYLISFSTRWQREKDVSCIVLTGRRSHNEGRRAVGRGESSFFVAYKLPT